MLSFSLILPREAGACWETEDLMPSRAHPHLSVVQSISSAPGRISVSSLACLCCPSAVLRRLFFLCYLSSAQYSSSHLSLPSPCNKSQPFYNPLGAVHNYPGSDCRSIYIRQCIGLASLMEVCVPGEWIFHDPTA